MLKEGENGTLWEYANLYAQNKGPRYTGAIDKFEGRSWCTAQGENGFPGISLSRWVLGFEPVKPGLKEIEINALYSPYKKFSGVLPTPQGLVKVLRDNNELILNVSDGVTALFSKEKLKENKVKKVRINGKEQIIEDIRLQKGKYTVEIVK